jgi:transcriptional regulator with XRE-family HTH domain
VDHNKTDTIKNRIDLLMISKKLTLKEIAESAGMDYRMLWRSLSNKRKFKPEELIAIAKKLETTTDFLLGENDNPEMASEAKAETISVKDFIKNKQAKKYLLEDIMEHFISGGMVQAMYKNVRKGDSPPSLNKEQVEHGKKLYKDKIVNEKVSQDELIDMLVEKVELIPPDQVIVYYRYKPFDEDLPEDFDLQE